MQEFACKPLQFLLGSHTFSDIAASARNPNRLSRFIMKSLPAFFENFDAGPSGITILYSDSGGRSLVEGRFKGCVHLRAVLRMNEFAERWTRWMETRIRLKMR